MVIGQSSSLYFNSFGVYFPKLKATLPTKLILQTYQETLILIPFKANKKMSGFIIFPEGAVISGNHVLRLKKGAFNGLLPI